MEYKNLMQAISNMHAEFGTVLRKDSRNNRNTYASLAGLLEQIHERCHKHGLVLIQYPCLWDNHHLLITEVTHLASGECKTGKSILTPSPNAQSLDQAWGGSTTYHRRYDAMMILGLFAADDPTDNDGLTPLVHSTPYGAPRAVEGNPMHEDTYIPKAQGTISEKQAKLLGWKLKELGKDEFKTMLIQKFGALENVTIEAFNKLKPDLGLN